LRFGEVIIDAIAFSMGYLANTLTENAIIDVAGELLADEWNGARKLKLRLVDIRIHEIDQV
jgi:hypothetical protein